MSMTGYTFELKDQIGGLPAVLAEIDIDVSYEVESDGGEPVVKIDGIFIDAGYRPGPYMWTALGAHDLLKSADPIIRELGNRAKAQIEADHAWCAARIAEDGWVYHGLGGNDPDGAWMAIP